MKQSNSRRRMLAAFAAMGIGTVAGLRQARAQDATTAPTTATVPCRVSAHLGSAENGQPNYDAWADDAQFAFLAPMKAVGDQIKLFSDLTGATRTSFAVFKGRVTRRPDGRGLDIGTMEIQWPFTAYADGNGGYFNVIGMAHEQNVPVGIAMLLGTVNLGEIVFEKGIFDPNNPGMGFDASTSAMVYESMRDPLQFKVVLAIQGTVYSSIEPEPGAFRALLDGPLLAAMDEAKRQDAESPCTETLGYDPYQDLECFLTGACCAVIGLPDRCWELETLRRFRDGWLASFAAGRADIVRYYRQAPAVAQRLIRSADGRRRLLGLYWRFIVPSALLARIGANRAAYALYKRMMLELLEPSAA